MTAQIIKPFPQGNLTYEVTLRDGGDHLVQVRKLRPQRTSHGLRVDGFYLQTIKPGSQNWKKMTRLAKAATHSNTGDSK